MLRPSLPLENRQMMSSLLGSSEFDFYQRWHDAIFVLSALASLLILGTEIRIRRQQDLEQKKWAD